MSNELDQLLEGVPNGWWPIFRRLYAELAADFPDVGVLYAKEKFAALRVGLHPSAPMASEVVNDASQESLITCQECGAFGRKRNISGRLATLCNAHFQAMNEPCLSG